MDEFYRGRQRCLKSVDDLVGTLVDKLEEAGVMDNTYIIYSTDNGYHIGQHRLQGGKTTCFEVCRIDGPQTPAALQILGTSSR